MYQHQRHSVALPPSRDYNVVPALVVHRADGLCHNVGGGSVPYSPAQWQQGSAHLQQNFPGLHHLPSQAYSGFQHPNLSYGQLSTDASACFNSLAHVPVLPSNYFDALAKNSERHCLCNGVQGRECWGQKASDVSMNTVQHQRDQNFAPLVGSSVAFPRDDRHVSAQTSSPILHSLLAENTPSRPPSATTSHERPHRSQQLKSSGALNCEKAQTWQNKNTTFQPDCTLPKLNSPDQTPTTSASTHNGRRQRLASDEMDQCTGQLELHGERRSKDSQVNAESTAKSETGCCATCSSKKHSGILSNNNSCCGTESVSTGLPFGLSF